MTGRAGRHFTFGSYRLDPEQRLLFRGDTEISLTPKTFETLRVLVENHGRLLTKDDLMRAVWPDTIVEENNLTQNISRLRKILTDAGNGEFIETLPWRGYRFVAPVEERWVDDADILVHRRTMVRVVTEEELDESEPSQAQPLPAGAMAGVVEAQPALLRPPTVSARSKSLVLGLVVGVTVLAVVALMTRGSGHREIERSREMRVERLTGSGRAVVAAISPEGQYVAFVTDAAGRQSLWLRQISTESDVEIVPPAAVDYWGITYSPDVRYIYYVAWERNTTDSALYRVPLLGGLARRVVAGVGNPIGFSPDGRQIAFTAENRLMLANTDGSHPHTLHRASSIDVLDSFFTAPAWSPDGSSVVLVAGNRASSAREQRIVEVRVEDGRTRTIHAGPWLNVGPIAWMRNGDGFLLTASDRPWAPRQIWHISYPGGQATRVSNDLHDYASLSLTLDNDAIGAVQTHTLSGLWLHAESGRERLLMSEVGDRTGAEGFSWTPDDKIVYTARSGDHLNLWRVSTTGESPRQLTVDAGNNFHPSVSPDGRYMVFASDRTGALRLWRMGLNGIDAAPLTRGREAVRPSMAADGRWVVYQEGQGWGVKSTIWKIPIEGGEAIELTDSQSIRPVMSPDGTMIAYFEMDAQSWRIAVISSEGGPPLARFPIPATGSRVLRWTPDGRGLAYIDDRDDVSNIWIQRLDGGPPTQLTIFPAGKIVAFGWSRDGRQLAYVRVTRSSDVVRLQNFAWASDNR